MSSPTCAIVSETVLYAHQDIKAGTVVSVNFAELRTSGTHDLPCGRMLALLRMQAYSVPDKCMCALEGEYAKWKTEQARHVFRVLALSDSGEDVEEVQDRSVKTMDGRTCPLDVWIHRLLQDRGATADALRPFRAICHEQLLCVSAFT